MIRILAAASQLPSVDTDGCVPALLTLISNSLSNGASQTYNQNFGIDVEVWRCIQFLFDSPESSGLAIAVHAGLDQASVSRCLKLMLARGLVTVLPDATDRRMKLASLTGVGRELYMSMVGLAQERDRALLSVLSPSEQTALITLLRRLHDQLPAVEAFTRNYMVGSIAGRED